MKKKKVFMDHDGGVDDFLSLLLLLTMDHVEIVGISITPADCYLENAVPTTFKLLQFANKKDIPVAVGSYYGINAFPAQWRAAPKVLNAFPALINIEATRNLLQLPESKTLLTAVLTAAEEPVTVLLTGPCSSLVQVLEEDPLLAAKIDEVIWMGGAVDMPGNVKTYNSNATQEWNVFWDAVSAKKLFGLGLNIMLIPLNATNSVPVSFEFLSRLASVSHFPFANLAAHFWATTVASIPSYETIYFMWDVLTTSYLAIPEIFRYETVELSVLTTGPNAGQTIRMPGNGNFVKMAVHANAEAFYQYVIQQFSR